MDSLIKLLKNVLNAVLIAGILTSPVYAKKKQHPEPQNSILATSYIVKDIDSGEIIVEKNVEEVRSIASITKLMTAMVVLDAGQDLNETIVFEGSKNVSSKLPKGARVTRSTLLLLTLMSSDNGSALTLAQHYPGGEIEAIRAMNAKAHSLGMSHTKFVEPTGLSVFNVSTAEELIKLTTSAYEYQAIRDFSTKSSEKIQVPGKKKPHFINFHTTNNLVASTHNVLLSKTGWIRTSGGCLVMIVREQGRRLAVILLNSRNTHTRIRDGVLLAEYNNVRNQRNFR